MVIFFGTSATTLGESSKYSTTACAYVTRAYVCVYVCCVIYLVLVDAMGVGLVVCFPFTQHLTLLSLPHAVPLDLEEPVGQSAKSMLSSASG